MYIQCTQLFILRIQKPARHGNVTSSFKHLDVAAPAARSLLKGVQLPGGSEGGPLMARFKRWTHGVVASIDSFIVQVENHEAQASSALRELEQGVARSKVQLMRVERDGKALEQALSEER